MRKNVFFQVFLLVMVGCLFFSCSNTPGNEVKYFAFQETKDGDWGLVAPNGDVLFSEEFKNVPTVVRDGRFFVQNDKGYWELFEADKNPKKIGGEYLSVSAFRNGYAFVVEKDKPVSIINPKGETVKELHKIEGKTVWRVFTPNINGYAVFQTIDSLYGIINVDGECVIKPEYIKLESKGLNTYIAVSKKYKDKQSKKVSILNQKGEVLFELSSDRYKDFGYTDGKLFQVAVEKNNEKAWGLLNEKGEEVFKPTTRIDEIQQVIGEKFIFRKDDKWGLMNLKGEKLIYAKYDYLFFDEYENVLLACKEDNGMSWKYIDADDEQLSPETYTLAYSFFALDGEHTLVKPDDNTYALINRDFEVIKGQPDMVDVNLNEGSYFVESDYLDMNDVIARLQLKQNSIFGLSLKSKPVDAVKLYVQWDGSSGSDEHKADDPYWYDYKSNLAMQKSVGVTNVTLGVAFNQALSRRVGSYDSSVYEWNDAKVQWMNFGIEKSSKLKNKMKALFSKIAEIYKKDATIVKQNKNALLLKCKDGTARCIYRIKEGIVVNFISETVATDFLENFSIDQFKEDIIEDDTNPQVGFAGNQSSLVLCS